MRNVFRRSMVVAVVAATLATFAVATPAQAVSTVQYKNRGDCLSATRPSQDNVAGMAPCRQPNTHWVIIDKGEWNGHQLVQLKNNWNGRCLDSHGSTTGTQTYVIGCNTGSYQIWEVFVNSNNTRTFKSWGAWDGPRRHMCLWGQGTSEPPAIGACDVRAAEQQFTRISG